MPFTAMPTAPASQRGVVFTFGLYGSESETECAVTDPGFGLYACVGSDAGTGKVPERAGRPLPCSSWFAPDCVALNVAVRDTFPPDASFDVASHLLALVFT